ncbi:symmetrical bis(5'-nucleosyl)-tetraphosphatase [Alteromonas sediminis]|uniref:bis(5'-nucleosyl)-tetraphosphatase (symmetrical) n=1 Tax=Alteromonas sediminis TaxID=2259342 RepID=A0A3N5XYQ5_9ALTE|nr:symmetrical bis(5'-nucleosyl)-tetraphosphatase [Alteromonas sediminis]RPJ65760.1 symmetrical bis(5'-nucleosyl)-tetraphosphatase [Alteromonas sediminis]
MNYVVGDIQGCYKGLKRLLKKIKFQPGKDTLWAAGDLVARGEDSLSTLAFLYDLGDNFKTVLGNHDLHLLAIHSGVKASKRADKLEKLLASKDVDKYTDWLRHQPLARRINDNTLLCHAGLYPSWSTDKAIRLSKEVEEKLQSKHFKRFLPHMYSSEAVCWKEAKDSKKRLTFVINAMTRMRYLSPQLALDFEEKCAPELARSPLLPWFDVNNKKMKPDECVVFGHWASLNGKTNKSNYIGLDTGYVWGNKMTVWCLETREKMAIHA